MQKQKFFGNIRTIFHAKETPVGHIIYFVPNKGENIGLQEMIAEFIDCPTDSDLLLKENGLDSNLPCFVC